MSITRRIIWPVREVGVQKQLTCKQPCTRTWHNSRSYRKTWCNWWLWWLWDQRQENVWMKRKQPELETISRKAATRDDAQMGKLWKQRSTFYYYFAAPCDNMSKRDDAESLCVQCLPSPLSHPNISPVDPAARSRFSRSLRFCTNFPELRKISVAERCCEIGCLAINHKKT
jgi:hypothetical protein